MRGWLTRGRRWLAASCGLLLGIGSTAFADEAELRALIEQQNQQIQAMKEQLDKMANRPGTAQAPAAGSAKLDDSTVKKMVGDYLKDNPGAGMPSGVQTGYSTTSGFVIRSPNDPSYVKWDDECKIPFELRFRGRIQLDYYGYKVTDNLNHQTQKYYAPSVGDFSQLEVKRLRLIWEGTVFDPNLRYHFELDGNTRGLGGTFNNRQVGNNDPAGAGGAPGIGFAGGAAGSNITPNNATGGGVTVDHAVRLFSAYVAYDFHGCASEKGCGPDCPEGTYKYAPTYTLIAGKMKPYFAFEEVLGSGNEQFVEFGMTQWMFDADNDNLLMAAGVQMKAVDDRLFTSLLITNGAESQFPNTQMDRYPGFNTGFWYDFGGTWDNEKHKWNLYGDCPSDIDYSCNPVVRVGSMAYIVPLDRRSIYGDLEQSFYRTMPAGPNGTTIINEFNGNGNPANAVDSFDAYTFEAFIAGKYHGFSLLNDWFVRDLTNWKTVPSGGGVIIDSAGTTFGRHALVDYGTMVQGGYFVVPKKAEVVARLSVIEGESGDVGTDYRRYHAAYEYSVGFNYYWKRQLLKWQTDLSMYDGGNPAAGGSSPAGFIAGVDGWLLRTQIQLAF